jgi:hypothetical protein
MKNVVGAQQKDQNCAQDGADCGRQKHEDIKKEETPAHVGIVGTRRIHFG